MQNTAKLVQGNQAVAEAAIYAGARFFAGYPITPSSEIAEVCSQQMPKVGGVYMQMEDELASIAALVGASMAGVKAFTATSGPGFSLMQENLGYAFMVQAPCVIVDVQRSGPSTGLATKPAQSDFMQMRWGRHGDQSIVALSPASVKECFALTVQAFNFAEKYRVPVILAMDEMVGHMRENFIAPKPGELEIINRSKPTCPPEKYKPFEAGEDGIAPLASLGSEYVFHVTSSMYGTDGRANSTPISAEWCVRQLNEKIDRFREELTITKKFDVDDCDILLIAFGGMTRAAREAALMARRKGMKAGVLQLVTLWPFPDEEVAELAAKAKMVVVPEMNYSGQMAREVRRVIGTQKELRKVNSYNGGIITPQNILDVIK